MTRRRTAPAISGFMILALVLVTVACEDSAPAGSSEPVVEVTPQEEAQRVDVSIGGQPFTSYIYNDSLTMLKKPVLYPIYAPDGTEVTRTWPLGDGAGERYDHPHHIGLWLNYGDVNGLDFWNNSDAIPEERADQYGTIEHREVVSTETGPGEGMLEVTADWLSPNGEALVSEDTRFVFHGVEGMRGIDRLTTLTANDDSVHFDDNKEGMLGLRLTRALEIPGDDPVRITGPDGEPMEEAVMDDRATGHYVNSEGIEGYPDVWGKRAGWVTLDGVVGGDSVTVAIFDHPDNVGYPTYWHARGYGLFAANPLGQEVFSEGEERLGFALAPGESTTFRHRILILDGHHTSEEIDRLYQDWTTAM